MRRRLVALCCTVAVVVVALFVYFRATRADTEPVIATAQVTRGDVIDSIDATGTVQAVTTVQVGSQISGTIKALHADFNSRVRRGQVIAELDPSLLEAQVAQARATVERTGEMPAAVGRRARDVDVLMQFTVTVGIFFGSIPLATLPSGSDRSLRHK